MSERVTLDELDELDEAVSHTFGHLEVLDDGAVFVQIGEAVVIISARTRGRLTINWRDGAPPANAERPVI